MARMLRLQYYLIAALTMAGLNAADGDTIPIPLNFDKNSVQFMFTKVSETNFAPLGTCFIVEVSKIHKPTFWHHLALPIIIFQKPTITQNVRYFVTAKHVLFDRSSTLSVDEIKDLTGIIDRLRRQSDPISHFLWQKFSNPEQSLLKQFQAASGSKQSRDIVVQALNRVIGGPCIHEITRFKGVSLRPETTELMKQNPTARSLAYLNRLLLEDAFPSELSRSLFGENGHLHPDMCMRLGNQAGGVVYGLINPSFTNGDLRIITPDDKSVDLAVFTIARPERVIDATKTSAKDTLKLKLGSFNASLIADNKKLKKYQIREGEQMFFVGLFTPFYGAKENIPICRFGHLSMLPNEPIMFEKEEEHLYLMETETFGGNSGSPAFFSFNQGYGIRRISELTSGQPLFSNTEHTGILFAGVVKGYFPDWSQVMVVNTGVAAYSSQNTGIAAIVPASYLYDMLFSKMEQEFRDKVWKLQFPAGYN
jgi:hypothetical protein